MQAACRKQDYYVSRKQFLATSLFQHNLVLNMFN